LLICRHFNKLTLPCPPRNHKLPAKSTFNAKEKYFMAYEIEALVNAHCACGENPLWLPESQQLLWEDIPNGRLFRLDVTTGHYDKFYDDELVGGFTVQADGSLLLFRDHNIALLREDGRIKVLCDDFDPQTGRFNDVMADPEGRVFAGTMGNDQNGGLYRVDLDGTITKLWDGTNCANGMGFTPDLRGFYWTSTSDKTIYHFDYDRASGELNNRREFLRVTDGSWGAPDGMTVDNNGNVWSAFWGGWGLRQFSPQGELLQHIKLPVDKTTSCIFGGANMNELYVTTAGGQDDAATADGTLYRVRVETTGTPEFRSRIQF
jgi:sugar lactone lactonase YvrE